MRQAILWSVRRTVANLWIATFFALALYFLLSYIGDNKRSLYAVIHLDWRLMCAAVVSQALYFFATVITWRLAVAASSMKVVGHWEALSQIALVNFGKYIPGKVWGLTARGARLKELGFEFDEIARASYIEQFFLLGSGALLTFFAASIGFGEPAYVLPGILIAVVIAAFNFSNRVIRKIVETIPRTGFLAKLLDLEMSRSILWEITLGYAAVWLLLGATFILLTSAFAEIGLDAAGISIMLLSLVAGYLAGFAAIFAPGGVGIREGIGATILSTMIPLEQALFVMLMFRIWTVLAELFMGFALLVRHYLSGPAVRN